MSITSIDDYTASKKDRINWFKTAARTTVAGAPFSLFDIAGVPGAGTLNVGDTTSGLVHTDATTGYPPIASFDPGATGHLMRVGFNWTVAGQIQLFDRLFVAGAFAYNADVTLSNQPSFASRVPDGDYRNLMLYIETVTAFTGNPSFQINYLDQDGNAGDTGVVASGAALTLGRCFLMPLASGDCGIQRVDRVRCTVATAGTFNVMILRLLWQGYVAVANIGMVHNFVNTGMPRVYDDSALYALVTATGTSSGNPQLWLEIANK